MQSDKKNTPPLEGIRVLSLDRIFSGPYAGLILSDLGAEVINVEPPEGDPLRNREEYSGQPAFNFVNRNRKSISLDLKTDEGLSVFQNLVEDSDVIIENMRSGVADRLNVDYENTRAINPDIVYCSIKGFFENRLRDMPSNDPAAQAMSGIMSTTGEEDGPPLRAGTSITDFGAGMYAVIGILGALTEPPGKRGQKIDTALFETGLSWMGHFLARYQTSGRNPDPLGSGQPHYAPYGAFRARNGWFFMGVRTEEEWERLCDEFGFDHLHRNPRFRKLSDRLQNKDRLGDILQAEFDQFSREEILQRLRERNIICANVYEVGDIMDNGHAENNDSIQKVRSNADGNEIYLPLTPIQSTSFEVTNRGNVPELGADTVDVLRGIGYDEDRIQQLLDKGIIGSSYRF